MVSDIRTTSECAYLVKAHTLSQYMGTKLEVTLNKGAPHGFCFTEIASKLVDFLVETGNLFLKQTVGYHIAKVNLRRSIPCTNRLCLLSFPKDREIRDGDVVASSQAQTAPGEPSGHLVLVH